MCFYHDYDWFTEVSETTEGKADTASRCDECGCRIHPGEWRHSFHMEEHEICRGYGHKESNYGLCTTDPDECSHGETFDYTSCESCWRIRKAIRQVEEADGCTGVETEPGLGMMFPHVAEGEGIDHYADKMLMLGLANEVALLEADDPDDVLIELSEPIQYYAEADYPGAWDDDMQGPWDLGGEG